MGRGACGGAGRRRRRAAAAAAAGGWPALACKCCTGVPGRASNLLDELILWPGSCTVASMWASHPCRMPGSTRSDPPTGPPPCCPRQLAKLSRSSAGHPRPPACQFDAAAALHAITPEGEEYQGLRAAATQLLGSQGREPADKVGAGGPPGLNAHCNVLSLLDLLETGRQGASSGRLVLCCAVPAVHGSHDPAVAPAPEAAQSPARTAM